MTEPKQQPAQGNAFWNFSLAIYASKQVQQACLELQDGSGVDVNVMLYVLWLATHGQTLSDSETSAILSVVDAWKSDVVVPLRTARRNLKSPPAAFASADAEALRTLVKKAELEAERQQQATLHGLRPVAGKVAAEAAIAAAAANLEAYGRSLSRRLAPEPCDVILSAFRALLEKG
ncbi:MAG: TIGR02444 family protein [Hyphomicrobiaceae bacterium]